MAIDMHVASRGTYLRWTIGRLQCATWDDFTLWVMLFDLLTASVKNNRQPSAMVNHTAHLDVNTLTQTFVSLKVFVHFEVWGTAIWNMMFILCMSPSWDLRSCILADVHNLARWHTRHLDQALDSLDLLLSVCIGH